VPTAGISNTRVFFLPDGLGRAQEEEEKRERKKREKAGRNKLQAPPTGKNLGFILFLESFEKTSNKTLRNFMVFVVIQGRGVLEVLLPPHCTCSVRWEAR
jgi:hypothetical protein